MKNNVFIIAEAGVNHNGDIEIAKQLIDVASSSGADAVKFQTFKTENVVTYKAQKAEYQKISTDNDESQFNMIKKLELSDDQHSELLSYSKLKNILFMSSPFDLESIDLLNNLGLTIMKIPSGEITNLPYLKKIGSLNKKIILSTGMSNIDEIENALISLHESGTRKENVIVLHANTMYPTQMADVNLNAMVTIGRYFDVSYGYSDHTLGIEVAIAAVSLGASCIEKHFTLDCSMEGPDHKASLEPDELKSMIDGIRNIEVALGSGVKEPSRSEEPNIVIARKSIVASKNIKEGDILNPDNITTKRPGSGISPTRWNEIVGTIATKNYNIDDFI